VQISAIQSLSNNMVYSYCVLSWFLIIGLAMGGCSTQTTAAPPEPTAAPSAESVQTGIAPPELLSLGQTLPLTAQFTVGKQTIQLEVASTPEQQATGLMNRKSLADDRGMLFPFKPARPVAFWMKNTLINLDMVFLYRGKVIAVMANIPPCKAEPCPTYGPPGPIDQVIELRGGRAAELPIKPGDRLTIQPL
jgi:uncharacterized protein